MSLRRVVAANTPSGPVGIARAFGFYRMKRHEIRSELLEQHAKLRGMVEAARRLVGRAHESESTRGEFLACLDRLGLVLRAHNAREEELLHEVLSTVDAWGPARAEIMGEQHVAEHAELSAILADARATSDTIIADGGLISALERLLEHMVREEKAFLGEDVLRDDSIDVDQFSG